MILVSQKPLAQRLDDIEAKMDELIEINKTTIASTKDFDADINAIKKEVNSEITEVFKTFHSVSLDWLHVIEYCERNNLRPRKVMAVIHLLNDDEDGAKTKLK